jgi:hypothetical protein
MAIDILSIPSMSAEPERVFSGGRRTIRWDRARLGVDNIERTECLKNWTRLGITRTGSIIREEDAESLLMKGDSAETVDGSDEM